MPINVYQVSALMANMFSANNTVPFSGIFASELPVVSDNINNGLTRYAGLSSRWASANYNTDHTFGNAQWTQDVGQGSGSGYANRANGGYYVRSVGFTNEGNNWGYVGSLTSTYWGAVNNFLGDPPYGVDTMGSNVDYDTNLLGHGASSTFPFPLTPVVQFRDPNSLPIDGTAYISSSGSAYTRSQYLYPQYQTLTINSSGTETVGSGAITFNLEQRASHNTIINSCTDLTSAYGDIFVATQQRHLNRRRLNILYGRIFGGINENVFVYPFEEDGTVVGVPNPSLPITSGNPMLGCYDSTALNSTTGSLSSRSTGIGDQRIRERAMFYINEEYYGIVQETKVVILSNKTTPIPLIFFDLADTWGSATGSRCAGVCVTGTSGSNLIYFISEAGSFVVYDFTQATGVLTVLATAPSLASGEAYGALATDGTNVYALNGCWSASPLSTTSGSGRIGITTYSIGSTTWGTANNSGLTGRHNSRALDEMIRLRSGYLATMVEKVAISGGNVINNDTTNIDWQLMVYDPSGGTWNTAQIDASGGFAFGTGYNKWAVYPQATIHDVVSGVLLVQCNWSNNALWSVNVSGSAAGISNSNLTPIGYGQSNNIFPVAVNATAKLTIRKSHSDDRTLFWFPEANAFFSGSGGFLMYMAPPSFNWTTGTLLTLPDNAVTGSLQNGGLTTTFAKDSLSHGSFLIPRDDQGRSGDPAYAITGFFISNYIPIFPNPTVPQGGQYGVNIIPSTSFLSMFGDNVSMGVVFIPTYWKQSGGIPALADNWADANNNPFAVPSTAGTAITLPFGLVAKFGPASGNTYANGEFHTFNATYGFIKYQRKARYAWSMFAGQTFINSETRSISALTAITPNIMEGNWGITVTGPSSITVSPYNHRTSAIWPKLISGSPQNTAAVMTVNFTNSPDPTTLLNVPGNGMVVTTDGTPTQPVANAFDGNPNNFWRSASGTGTHYIQIDLGTAATALSYSLRFNTETLGETPASWTLQGSNDNSTWTNLDPRTLPSPLFEVHAFSIATSGSYRYYRLSCVTSGSNIQIGSFRLFSANLISTVNFSEIQFMNGFERGLTFQVDTGSGFNPITPLWRAHNGGTFCFSRQTGVQNLKITVQYGANELSPTSPFTPTGNAIMGGYQLIDYGTQSAMDAARLGNISYANLTPVDPRAASFETQCIGIAADTVMLTIDGDASFVHNPYSPATAIWNFYDWVTVPIGQFKTHPFWGFIVLPGGGGNGQSTSYSGTTATLTYNWGRRV